MFARLVLAALLVPVAVAIPGSASAELIFRGDFETGDLSQWHKTQIVSSDRAKVVTSPVAEGKHSLQVTVKKGDDPIASSGNRNEVLEMTLEPEGSESWYRWHTMFAEDFPSADTWQLFLQWHHRGNDGSPPMNFSVRGEEIMLRANKEFIWRTPLKRGKWFEFLFHVKWSPDKKVGFVELWVDGQLALPKTYVPTQFPGQLNYLKMGLYRDEAVGPTGVLWHDGLLIGTKREDVMPATTPTPVEPTPTDPETPVENPDPVDPAPVDPDPSTPTDPAPEKPTLPLPFPDVDPVDPGTDEGQQQPPTAGEEPGETAGENTEEEPTGGCSAAPGATMLPMALGLAALLLRRRREE